MAENLVAIMLPEYEDVANPVSSCFCKISVLYSDEEVQKIIQRITNFVSFFKEEESRLIYDGENIKGFTYPLRELADCYPSRERQIRIALKGLENWRSNRLSNSNDGWKCYHSVVDNEIRSEFATRNVQYPDNSYVIAVCLSNYKGCSWELENEDNKITLESYPMDIATLFKWQSNNHKPLRQYNWNEKHGEYGKGAHPSNKGDRVDVLLGSRDEAKDLLQYAIGPKGYDYLYAYDPKYSSYMEYKAELKSANMTGMETERYYHSFHLSDETTISPYIKLKIRETIK